MPSFAIVINTLQELIETSLVKDIGCIKKIAHDGAFVDDVIPSECDIYVRLLGAYVKNDTMLFTELLCDDSVDFNKVGNNVMSSMLKGMNGYILTPFEGEMLLKVIKYFSLELNSAVSFNDRTINLLEYLVYDQNDRETFELMCDITSDAVIMECFRDMSPDSFLTNDFVLSFLEYCEEKRPTLLVEFKKWINCNIMESEDDIIKSDDEESDEEIIYTNEEISTKNIWSMDHSWSNTDWNVPDSKPQLLKLLDSIDELEKKHMKMEIDGEGPAYLHYYANRLNILWTIFEKELYKQSFNVQLEIVDNIKKRLL